MQLATLARANAVKKYFSARARRPSQHRRVPRYASLRLREAYSPKSEGLWAPYCLISVRCRARRIRQADQLPDRILLRREWDLGLWIDNGQHFSADTSLDR